MIRLAMILLLASCAFPADFVNGQAARVVIGQSSFSSHDRGISPTSMAVPGQELYWTEPTGELHAFDLTRVAGSTATASSGCVICNASSATVTAAKGASSAPFIAVHGKTLVVADTANHRVLIWRNMNWGLSFPKPDVVLGGAANLDQPVSAATLVEPVSVAFDGKRLFVGDRGLHRVLIWNSLPSTSNQPADTVLGQANLTSVQPPGVLEANTIENPCALASDGNNLFLADSTAHRILIFTPGDVPLQPEATVNAASLVHGSFAPGTLVTIWGRELSDGSVSAPDDGVQALPTSLGGTEVLLNGKPLPIFAVSPTQVRTQLPYELDGASAASLYVRTEHGNGAVTISNAIDIHIASGTPGLFALGGAEPRSGLAVHINGTPITPQNPAKPGETIIAYGTGLGAVSSGNSSAAPHAGIPYTGAEAPVLTPVQAFVNGAFAKTITATLPSGSVGVYSIQVQVPEGTGNSNAKLLVVQNGNSSNVITFPVSSFNS